MRKVFILLEFVFLFNLVSAQEYQSYSYETVEDEFGYYKVFRLRDSIVIKEVVRDTVYISGVQDITTNLDMTFDEFVKRFMKYVSLQDSLSEEPYVDYFKGLIVNEFKKYRYILNEYTIDFSKDNSLKELKTPLFKIKNSLPDAALDSLNIDFLFVLKGEKNTSFFLNSPKLQIRTLYQILTDIQDFNEYHSEKVGLNFYFPDFDFREKRAMAQFIKSVSLVSDSIQKESIRNVPIYFTFEESEKNLEYLKGMSFMVDKIFLAKPRDPSGNFMTFLPLSISQEEMSLFQQLKNQVYLARFFLGKFPQTSQAELLKSDIEKLFIADYPDALWEYYMFIIFIAILLLAIGTCCYLFIPAFSNFVHDNAMYFYAGGILLVLEIYLLLVFMIEGASKTVVFSFQGNNLMLFLPLLVIFVIPLFKQIVGKRDIP